MPLTTTEYDLHGQLDDTPVRLTYTRFERTAAATGHVEPDFLPADRLHVVHGDLDRTLSGDGFAVLDTAVGTLLTLELFVVPDLGTTSLAVLIPQVAFPADGGAQQVRTVVVRSLRKSSFAPQTDVGQLQTCTAVHVHGHASRSTDGSVADTAAPAAAQPVSAASPTG